MGPDPGRCYPVGESAQDSPAISQAAVVSTDEFSCGCCDGSHAGVPFAWHMPAPDYWHDGLEDREDCVLDSDLCVIEDEHFFVRGLIELSVLGTPEPFHWGVWVSLSRAS